MSGVVYVLICKIICIGSVIGYNMSCQINPLTQINTVVNTYMRIIPNPCPTVTPALEQVNWSRVKCRYACQNGTTTTFLQCYLSLTISARRNIIVRALFFSMAQKTVLSFFPFSAAPTTNINMNIKLSWIKYACWTSIHKWFYLYTPLASDLYPASVTGPGPGTVWPSLLPFAQLL